MKKYLFLLLFLPITASALTREQVQAEVARCETYALDWNKADACMENLAVQQKNIFLCDKINWRSKRLSCRRRIQYEHSWKPSVLGPKLPFVFYTTILAVLIIARPPRKPYFSGVIFGGAFAGLQLAFFHYSFIQYLKVPINGLSSYAPYFFLNLTEDVQLIAAHCILYGIVIGLLLQGEKHLRKWAAVWFLLAIIITYWAHPQFDTIRSLLPTIPGISWQ